MNEVIERGSHGVRKYCQIIKPNHFYNKNTIALFI
jgi:hypothetical protein